MKRAFPLSLLFFASSGLLFVLQMIPHVGFFLMLIAAMFWSVLLINAGMIGIGIEVFTGRVYRAWAFVPLIFYGGYVSLAAYDHYTLAALRKSYDSANSKVHVPFDPERQSLVFEGESSPGGYTRNYALDVVYSTNENYPEEFRSTRMIEQSICETVREDRSLGAAGIHAFGFRDGNKIGSRASRNPFCNITMLEAPDKPILRVKSEESMGKAALLPFRRVITTVTTPEGRSFELKGGSASPLSWIPRPIMGCALNSGKPSWDCIWAFGRETFTPIVSGGSSYDSSSGVLARALGLRPVSKSERRGAAMPEAIRMRMKQVKRETLRRQLANVDAMIAQPLMDSPDWNTRVLEIDPNSLSERSTEIMGGVEDAAAVEGDDRFKARESGRILARLLAALPDEDFQRLGPRVLTVYRNAGEEHWLWETERLIRRLGDLGVEAMPYLANGRASGNNVNGAGIEGMCRVGIPGRALAKPALLRMWNSSREGFDRDRREALFVTMRRMGIDPPQLADDERDQVARLNETWADISPESPPTVCSIRQEALRRKQKQAMARRTRH